MCDYSDHSNVRDVISKGIHLFQFLICTSTIVTAVLLIIHLVCFLCFSQHDIVLSFEDR